MNTKTNPCKRYKLELKLLKSKKFNDDPRERNYSSDEIKRYKRFNNFLINLFHRSKCIKWSQKIKKYKNKRKFKKV